MYIKSNYGIGQNSNDQLMHWKYIKKVWKNGKWKYYYDHDQLKDDLGVDEKEAMEKAEDTLNTTAALMTVASEANRKNVKDAAERAKEFDDPSKATAYNNKYESEAKENMRKHEDNYNKAYDNFQKAKAEYYKTPLGKIEKAAEKAKKWISKIFN